MISKEKNNKKTMQKFLKIGSNMVLELLVGTVIGGAIGYYIDVIFQIYPVCMLVFGFFGFLGGMMNIYKSCQNI